MLKFADLKDGSEFQQVINLFSGWLERAAQLGVCRVTGEWGHIILKGREGKTITLNEWLKQLQYSLNLTIYAKQGGEFAGLAAKATVADKAFKRKDANVYAKGGINAYFFTIDTVHNNIIAVNAKTDEEAELDLPERARDALNWAYRKWKEEYAAACEKTRRELAEAV